MSTEPLDTPAWVPQACTLPTAEQPLRIAEFDNLFAAGLEAVERLTPTRLQLRLAAELEPITRDLTARETRCCSFFTFAFATHPNGGTLLEVTVPEAHVAVLDAISHRATTSLPT